MSEPADYGAFFAHESGTSFTDPVAELTSAPPANFNYEHALTGQMAERRSFSSRSTPGIFEYEVTAQPKRAGADVVFYDDEDEDEDYIEEREPWLTS